MPHQEFVGLTKEERRQVPHHHDKIIHVEGHSRLRVGFWQSDFKVKDHAEVHGLECTKENTIKFIQFIADMPNRPNVKWFDNGTYQGQTERGYPAVHIYDLDKQVIAVFKKETGNFITRESYLVME